MSAAMAGAAAATMAQAAQTVHASTPSSGSGTPLMTLATYLLYAECALIILLSVPLYVPYRRQLLEWIHYSPRLWTVRVVIGCVHAFVAILLADTYLRLNRTTLQIEGIQASHAHAMAAPAMAAAAAANGGFPPQQQMPMVPPVPTAHSAVDSSGHMANLNDLFSARFRGQRDFYVLAFTLFCSTVLFQLHLLLIKMDKFRAERDALLAKEQARLAPLTKSPAAGAATTPSSVTEQISASVKNASNAISGQVDALLHPNGTTTRNNTAVVSAPTNTPAKSAEPAAVVQQRVVYTTKQE
ncbi:hypothetical protein HDU86_002171 [Geranomyces michiganensis]|nr:hypothetical protein HDU86_002171 [Geranomyces michiganensis]